MELDKLKELKYEKRLTTRLILSIFGVVIVWLTITIMIHRAFGDQSGVIGDSFGAVNALFSSLAFAFLIYTAMMQRIELKYQREELRATREVMLQQQAAMEETMIAQKEQASLIKLQVENELKRMKYVYLPFLQVKDLSPRNGVIELKLIVTRQLLQYKKSSLSFVTADGDDIEVDLPIKAEPTKELYPEKSELQFKVVDKDFTDSTFYCLTIIYESVIGDQFEQTVIFNRIMHTILNPSAT